MQQCELPPHLFSISPSALGRGFPCEFFHPEALHLQNLSGMYDNTIYIVIPIHLGYDLAIEGESE
jgi:hypothetical protein